MFIWSLWTTFVPCYTEYYWEHISVPPRGGTSENHEIHHKSCCHPGSYHCPSIRHQNRHPSGAAVQYCHSFRCRQHRQPRTAPCNGDDRTLGGNRHRPRSTRHGMAAGTSSVPGDDPSRHGGQHHPCRRLLACHAEGLQAILEALAWSSGRRCRKDGIPVLRHRSDRWHAVRSAARSRRIHQILVQLAPVRHSHYRGLPVSSDCKPYQATDLILELRAKQDTPRTRGVVMYLLLSSGQHSQMQSANRAPETASYTRSDTCTMRCLACTARSNPDTNTHSEYVGSSRSRPDDAHIVAPACRRYRRRSRYCRFHERASHGPSSDVE